MFFLILTLIYSIESLLKFVERNKDALSEYLKICFESGKSVLLSSDLGNHVLYSCVRYLLENHILGKSWNGNFELGDWDVINGSQIVLSKPPTEKFEIGFGAKDLAKLDALLLPKYQKDDKDGTKVTPLFFGQLDVDLTTTAAELKEEDLPWYREYMLSNPAYQPPMARIDLIRGLYREIKTHNLSNDPTLHQILTDPAECRYDDWRVYILASKSSALIDLFWHGVSEDDRKKPDATPKYNKSLGSFLDLERNSCEHLEERTRVRY